MKVLIFLGSSRDSSPPQPPRLGLRVVRYVQNLLKKQMTDLAAIEIIDPLDLELGPVFKPYFAYTAAKAPEDLKNLAQKIESADAYVMVSPEYNHSMSPVLAHLLNHFGSSLFSFKPSLIVTYSAGQWGG